MKKLLLIPAALAAFMVLHRPEKPQALVFDRPWLDHMPRSEREEVQVFMAFGDEKMGSFIATTRWKGQFEGFKFDVDGDKLRAVFPQNGDKETLSVKAEACHQPGFDLCLELDGGTRGVKRYFSRKEWRAHAGTDVMPMVFE